MTRVMDRYGGRIARHRSIRNQRNIPLTICHFWRALTKIRPCFGVLPVSSVSGSLGCPDYAR